MKIILILTAIIFFSGCITTSQELIQEIPNHTNISINISLPAKIQLPIPETVYSQPHEKPQLRPYQIDKSHDFWHAQNPQSYIIPENEWVKYYAAQLYIDKDGWLRYKNIKIPLTIYPNRTVILWQNQPFLNNYISDDMLFNYPPNADYWQNADYYLANGQRGDCEDWAIAIVSMMQSGEISLLQNETFKKQKMPAKVVMGYVGTQRDTWAEYTAYNNTFISTTSPGQDYYGVAQSSTIFFIKSDERHIQMKSLHEFTNSTFGATK